MTHSAHRTVLFLTIIFLTVQTSVASHLAGCEISYRYLDTFKYEVTIKYYRDCKGVPLNVPSYMVSCDGSDTDTLLGTRISINDLTPVCKTQANPCSPSNSRSGEGLEEHTYRDTLDFNSSNLQKLKTCGGKIRISVQTATRSSNINTGPTGSLFNYALLDLKNFAKNSSPVFTTNASMLQCCNQPVFSNVGARDTFDGDSLSYSFSQPLRSWNTILSYTGIYYAYNHPFQVFYPGSIKPPFSNINANPPIGIYLDPETGDLIYTPTRCDEVTVAVIKVTEWRKDSNGVSKKIGESHRDLQYITKNCPNNNPPEIEGPFSYDVCEGSKLCFDVKTEDGRWVPPPPAAPHAPDTVTNTWNRGIPGATYTVLNDSARLQTGRFCWTPEAGMARDNPYSFVVTARDNACPLNAVSSRGFRVRVKPRVNAEVKISPLTDKQHKIELVIDSSTFLGNPSVNWSLLDSSSTPLFDSTIGYIYSTKSFVSRALVDTLSLLRNSSFVLQSDINNLPINCPVTVYDTIYVDSLFTVQIDYPNDTTVCAGTTVLLKTSTEFEAGNVLYQWYKNDTFKIPGATSKDLKVVYVERDSADTYTVKATDALGHTNSDIVRIRSLDNVRQSFAKNLEKCEGDSVQLNMDLAYTNMLWSTGDTNAAITVLSQPKISVTYTDTFGCGYTDTIVMRIDPLPRPKLRDSTFCEDKVRISPGSFKNVIWSNRLTSDSITVLSASWPQTFTVEVTDSNGCKNRDTATISFYRNKKVSLGNDTIVCDKLTLSADITGTYKWSTGNTSSNIIVLETGLYAIEVADPDGCISVDSTAITVLPLPTQSWGDTVTLCGVEKASLSSDSFVRYRWQNDQLTQTIEVNSSGIYSLFFEGKNGCFNRDSIYVNFLKAPTQTWADSVSYCSGETAEVESNVFKSYLWSTGEVTRKITASNSGFYTVIFEASNGCSNTDSIYVLLDTISEISLGNDTVLCATSYKLAQSGDNQYFWSTGSTAAAIEVNTSGKYWVRATSRNGCIKSDTINVELNENRVLPYIQLSNNIIFSDQLGVHYWFEDGIQINDATDSFLLINTTATYSAVHIDSNGCHSDTSNKIKFTNNVIGLKKNEIKTYPNPSSGYIEVTVADISTIKSILLFNNLGQQVETNMDLSQGKAVVTWNAIPGIYYLFIQSTVGSAYHKVIVE